MSYRATVIKGGKVVVPAALRREFGIKDGDTILFDADDGVLRIRTHRSAFRNLQRMVRSLVPPGTDIVAGLLADRRAENARDEAGTKDPLHADAGS